jgi:MFS family permease
MSLEGNSLIHHHFWRLKNTELNEIFFFMSVRTFTLSMIAIFVPIYYLKVGLSIQSVFMYLLMLYGFSLFFFLPAAWIIGRLGPKKAIVMSVPILIIHLFLIQAVGTYHISYLWAALLGGMEIALYWPSYHLDFARAETARHSSSQVATMAILASVVGALAPFIGGIISGAFGFNTTIVLGSALLFTGAFVFNRPTVGRKLTPITFNFKKIKISKIRRDLIANWGTGWETFANGACWSLFVYLIVKNYQSVGLVTSLGLLITIGLTWYLSKRADRGYRRKYIKYGFFMASFLDIIQSFVQNIFHVFAINVAGSFAYSFKNAPYTSEYYLRANENEAGPYVILMEIVINIARVVLIGFLLFLTYYLELKYVLMISFVFAAVGAIMATYMPISRVDVQELRAASIKLSPKPAQR